MEQGYSLYTDLNVAANQVIVATLAPGLWKQREFNQALFALRNFHPRYPQHFEKYGVLKSVRKYLEVSVFRKLLAKKYPPQIMPLQTNLHRPLIAWDKSIDLRKIAVDGVLSSITDVSRDVLRGRLLLIFRNANDAKLALKLIRETIPEKLVSLNGKTTKKLKRLQEFITADLLTANRDIQSTDTLPPPIQIAQFREAENLLRKKFEAQQLLPTRRITIAVIDSGIDHTLKDLGAQVDQNTAFQDDRLKPVSIEVPKDVNSELREGDPVGHGTKVVGCIAAQRGNNTGVEGAYLPARVISYRVYRDNGRFDFDAYANAFDHAINEVKAHVINISLSGSELELERLKIIRAAAKNVFIVASIPNRMLVPKNGKLVRKDVGDEFPAKYAESPNFKNVIAVGSYRFSPNIAKANLSPDYDLVYCDILGPGGDDDKANMIPVLKRSNDLELGEDAGTSFAAAYVTAGVAMIIDAIALKKGIKDTVLDQDDLSNITPDLVRESLQRGGDSDGTPPPVMNIKKSIEYVFKRR